MVSCTSLVSVNSKIEIEDTEQQIFDHLLGTLSYCSLSTQLRVAGGWVRDKLLGKTCKDIDIAVDNMSGIKFCEKLNEYLSFIGEKTRGVSVIPCCPEKSKHLETATIKICDMRVDFANLRFDYYNENTRIPTVRIGTPKEDAERRDLTINSLFYNINSGTIEDLTGRGIADLNAKKIVTPLPPKRTLLDDPLRILRAIRFGARLDGFVLDTHLMEVAACDDVRCAFCQKITRDRLGGEVDLMITGILPVQAMIHIFELNLFWIVFKLPPSMEPLTCEERHCIFCMDVAWALIRSIKYTFSDEERRLCLFAGMFLPLHNALYEDEKSKKIPVVNYILSSLNLKSSCSLNLKSSCATVVVDIHNVIHKFKSLIPSIVSNKDMGVGEHINALGFADLPFKSALRLVAGMVVCKIKEFWRVALLVCILLYPSDVVDFGTCRLKRSSIFDTVESAIKDGLGLERVWDEKPLVNGNDIMVHLKIKGPLVGKWKQKVLQWQLAHPSGTSAECLDWMRERHSQQHRSIPP